MTNRAIRSLSTVARVTQFGYLVVVTVLIALVGAAAVTFFERGAPDSAITSFGDGLWWSSTVISTVNGPNEPVTFEGRVVAVVLRVFGLVVVSYFTARLAVFFLGGHAGIGQEGRQADLAELREEIERLTEAVRAQRRQ
ncbi:MAG: potassium channel family protein [Chloroflexi bacterium]|nr:potassium channel family protein [Chloroflexota bacterium]